MIEPKILLKGPFDFNQITISHNQASNRKLDSKIESMIEETWNKILKEAKEKGQEVYDGTSLRLDSF